MSDPHFTAEKVLEGRLVSQVRFTEFRVWMLGQHPVYLTDDELIALYDQHVKHRDEYLISLITPAAQPVPAAQPEPDALTSLVMKMNERVIQPDPERFLRVVKAPDKSTQPPLTKRLSRKAKKAARRARKRLRKR